MKLNVKFFGKLSEVTGAQDTLLEVDEVLALNELEKILVDKYELLGSHTYLIAVNQEINNAKNLEEGDEIAFLPPFAGG